MSWLTPAFEGHMTIEPLPEDFAARIGRRVDSGLLAPGHRERANYEITSRDRSGITFVARGFLTTYNVGLNEVTVDRCGADRIHYQVSYWGWTRAAVVHGLLLGGILAAAFALYPSMRRDVAQVAHGAWMFWTMVPFWAVVFPWLLTAFHKRFAEGCLRRILTETLGPSPAGAADQLEGAERQAS